MTLRGNEMQTHDKIAYMTNRLRTLFFPNALDQYLATLQKDIALV